MPLAATLLPLARPHMYIWSAVFTFPEWLHIIDIKLTVHKVCKADWNFTRSACTYDSAVDWEQIYHLYVHSACSAGSSIRPVDVCVWCRLFLKKTPIIARSYNMQSKNWIVFFFETKTLQQNAKILTRLTKICGKKFVKDPQPKLQDRQGPGSLILVKDTRQNFTAIHKSAQFITEVYRLYNACSFYSPKPGPKNRDFA